MSGRQDFVEYIEGLCVWSGAGICTLLIHISNDLCFDNVWSVACQKIGGKMGVLRRLLPYGEPYKVVEMARSGPIEYILGITCC